MSFFGKTFVYNNISCEAYDLMLYDIDGGSEDESEFASPGTIEEETVGRRWRPFFYGVRHEGKLSFDLVFGVHTPRLERNDFLDRYELSEVAAWLTGHDKYLYLDIEQSDMQFVRYRAIITALSVVSYSQIPWALKATVECDSPYAYMYPQTTTCTVNGTATINIFNRSSLNDYYYPMLTIEHSGGTISLQNAADNDRLFQFTDLPAGTGLITVNNENCLIKCANGLNIYPYFNNHFFRLRKGLNTITVTGNGTINITCEFPINTGG